MKLARMLATSALAIVLTVIISTSAAAHGMSLELAQPGALDIDPVFRTQSLELALPLQVEHFEKTPAIDMGIYPCDTGAARQSLFWNAFPQQPQAGFFSKNPTQEIREPLQCDHMAKNPTQEVREPLNIECCGPTMNFNLKEDAHAEIAIYNVSGRLVRRLSERIPSGESSLTWDGMDDRGSRAASGVYFARVQTNGETGKGKLVVVH